MTDQKRPEYLVPALIAGAVAGVLSGIPFVNCLCCLWIIGGAVLATSLLAKNTSTALTAGDGAIVGALTGIVAAVVDGLISIPLQPVNAAVVQRLTESLARVMDELPAAFQDLLRRETSTGFSLAGFFLGLFITAAIFAVLGLLGGVIGVSLFGRKKTPSPPQPQSGPPHAAV
jgi:hypothetical protein